MRRGAVQGLDARAALVFGKKHGVLGTDAPDGKASYTFHFPYGGAGSSPVNP